MLLYFLAYTCNLLATPLDDQLAYEARRDPLFFTLPLPAAFQRRLALWHVLNLIRVITCGLAWVLVCYRSNHFVMLKVFEARAAQAEEDEGLQQQQQQHLSTRGVAPGGASSFAAGADAASGTDASRRLQRMGSNLGSFASKGGANQQQQQQWAVLSKRVGSVGGTAGAGSQGGVCASSGTAGSPGGGWTAEQCLMAGHPSSSN